MTEKLPLDHPDYDPAAFIDWLVADLNAHNDKHLARKLEVEPAQISRIRNRRVNVSCTILLAIHEKTGLHIREIRARMVRKTAV